MCHLNLDYDSSAVSFRYDHILELGLFPNESRELFYQLNALESFSYGS